MRIAISPDENPGDTGSVASDGTTERSVNLMVAAALHDVLVRCGQDAWFDADIDYVERVKRANGDGTQLLVACAHNESTPGLSGTQFVFCPGGAVFGRQGPAAANVYAELRQLPGWPDRRADAVEDIYECCEFEKDTVYIEYLFMSPDDRPIWSQQDYPVLAAEATARGLAVTYGFKYVPRDTPIGPPPVAPADPDSGEGGKPVVTAIFHDQMHLFWSDKDGKLKYTWQGGHALTDAGLVLAEGMVPGGLLSAQTFGGQLHVFGPRADGKVQHVWSPAGAVNWGSEVLG